MERVCGSRGPAHGESGRVKEDMRMRKDEYMGALKAALAEFDEELVQEIIEDYEERFRIGAEQGRAEEEIVKELGSIKDLVEELGEMQRDAQNIGKKTEAEANGFTAQSNSYEGQTQQEPEWEEKKGTDWKKTEEDFTNSLNTMMRSLGKVVDMAMKEAGKAIELAAEQIEIHIDEAKKNRNYYTYNGENVYEESERENGEEPNVEQCGEGGENCRKVVLDANIADVRIRSTKEPLPRAVCHYYSHKTAMVYPFYAYQEGDTFYVGIRQKQEQERKSGYFQFNMSPSIEIDLFLPEGVQILEGQSSCGDMDAVELMVHEVRLSSKSGDIEVSRLESNYCRMEALSGDLNLTKSDVKKAELATKSGDCDVNKINTEYISVNTASGDICAEGILSKQVTLGTASGDLEADGIQSGKMAASTASGDMRVEDCTGEHLTATSASGDVEVRADFMSYECRSQSGDVHLESRHDADINAQSTSGDVLIELLDAVQEYQVSLHSVSGDCTTTGQRRQGNDGSGQVRRINGKSISGDVTVRFL